MFVGKAAANFLLIAAMQLVTALLFALVFDLDLSRGAWGLAGVAALGTLGISSVGTLFGAMAVRTRFRDVLLPILLLPALFPVLAGAVTGSAEALRDGVPSFESVQLLLVIDGVYWILCFTGFEYVLDE